MLGNHGILGTYCGYNPGDVSKSEYVFNPGDAGNAGGAWDMKSNSPGSEGYSGDWLLLYRQDKEDHKTVNEYKTEPIGQHPTDNHYSRLYLLDDSFRSFPDNKFHFKIVWPEFV